MPIQKVGNAYRLRMESGDDVDFGEEAAAEFTPRLTLRRWGGECDLKITPPALDGSLTASEDVVEYGDSFIALRFYHLSPSGGQNELGGVELELILKEKPASNVFTFNIEVKGLRFYYQPPLTPEEETEGCIRPENVAGSYAVYHATRSNVHAGQADAEKYKAGKAFHIYRPKAVDAVGQTAWCDLHIDEADGILTVTVPQMFLDSAVYPVAVDPTFGYETIGGSIRYHGSGYMRGSFFTCPEAGTLESISIYVEGAYDPVSKYKLVLYQKSDEARTDYTPERVLSASEGPAWFTDNVISGASLTAQDYYIVCWSGGGSLQWRYDYLTGKSRYKTQSYSGDPPDPWGSTYTENYKFSSYCTYTAGGGVTEKLLSDSGSGVEALTPLASVTLADVGAGVDALGDRGLHTLDVGVGAEAFTVTATLSLSDGGAGVDSLTAAVLQTLSDSGAGADSLTATATIPLTDSGAGVEAVTVTAAVSLSDVGSGVDVAALIGAWLKGLTLQLAQLAYSLGLEQKRYQITLTLKPYKVTLEELN